jgi:hypothetical protein
MAGTEGVKDMSEDIRDTDDSTDDPSVSEEEVRCNLDLF